MAPYRPPAACLVARGVLGRRLQIAGGDAAIDARVAQVDGDAERAQAVHALQLLELDVLHLAGEIAERLQILDVAAVLVAFGGVRVDDRDLPGLRDPLGGPLDDRLVDPLLDDLVADVISAVDVEALLVEPEADRERRVLD